MLEEKISEQDQIMSQTLYNKERLDMMFKRTSSYLSNIIVKTAHLLKNLTKKMKLTSPIMLSDLFKKYASLDYFPADHSSPQDSSYSPSKKGSRLNLEGGGGGLSPDYGGSRLNVGSSYSPNKNIRLTTSPKN